MTLREFFFFCGLSLADLGRHKTPDGKYYIECTPECWFSLLIFESCVKCHKISKSVVIECVLCFTCANICRIFFLNQVILLILSKKFQPIPFRLPLYPLSNKIDVISIPEFIIRVRSNEARYDDLRDISNFDFIRLSSKYHN